MDQGNAITFGFEKMKVCVEKFAHQILFSENWPRMK